MKDENTMVITYIDENYEENLENDFVATLRRKANYKGKIVVLDYGVSEDVVTRVSSAYDVEFVRCKKDISVFSQRYRDIPAVINAQDESITHVMVIDGGDIWFQKDIMPIFRATVDKVGCVEESVIMGENEWTDKCLFNLSKETQEEILKYCKGKHVKNSGMVAGPRELIEKIIKNIYYDIYNSGIEYFGIDQLFFNYQYMKLDVEMRTLLDNEFNFVLITNKEGYYIKEEDIYREDNKLVTIVHNAGGAWRLIKRSFVNKKSDYEQYILENVKHINEKVCS